MRVLRALSGVMLLCALPLCGRQAPAAGGTASAGAGASAQAAAPSATTAGESGYAGVVQFDGVGVPGAVVTATQDEKKFTTVTAPDGSYRFEHLDDGAWTITVQMTGFAPLTRTVTIPYVAPAAPASGAATPPAAPALPQSALALLPYTGPPPVATPPPAPATAAKSSGKNAAPAATNAAAGFQQATLASTGAATPETSGAGNAGPAEVAAGDANRTAANALTVNASMNNGAASPFAQSPAFGNNRNGRSLYNGALAVSWDTSLWDASQFSITGAPSQKLPYNTETYFGTVGGPLLIPHIFTLSNAPQFVISYQMMRQGVDSNATGIMPTLAEQEGNLSALPGTITNPSTGQTYSGNMIPTGDISKQATALLALYPLPNVTGNPAYNYQAAIDTVTHQDSLQFHINKSLNRSTGLAYIFGMQDTRTSTPNIFDFLDTNDSLGQVHTLLLRHTFSPRFYGTFQFQYSRSATTLTPFFSNRTNISGADGITGNLQSALYWGPPSLTFGSSGFTGLTDGNPEHDRNQTGAFTYQGYWSHGRHEFSFGGDYRRLEFNYLQEQNPRGSFTFTGAASGIDFADFLLGIPDSSAIDYGNADKYLRETTGDGYFTDVFRFSSGLTLDLGARWEYAAPMSELYNRLVNLDVAPGFTAASPVLASSPVGAVTGATYPSALLHPDYDGIEPRLGLAWRPLAASSLVVKASYAVYFNTSVYQNLAWDMANQAPLAVSLNVANSASTPLTLADGFVSSTGVENTIYGINPNFRIGYVQTWDVSLQRDLPGAMVGILSYDANKGTDGMQEFYPNSYAPGATSPCSACPIGFEYFSSGGNSTFESGKIQIQRRLSAGLAATAYYVYEDASDDSVLGGGGSPQGASSAFVAQNWLDLDAERGLSSFEQRNQFNLQLQYTTGMTPHAGAMLTGWRASAYKGWTILGTFKAVSGMPETPEMSDLLLPTIGVANVVRPDTTGASVYAAPAGLFLNPAAYTAPPSGEFGDAGRDSVIGPGSWYLNASLQRTFQVNDRINAQFRIDSNNALNHPYFTNWNVLVGTPSFGLPQTAQAMRNLTTTVRFTF